MTAPTVADLMEVEGWLVTNGIEFTVDAVLGMVTVTDTVREVEALFKTEMHVLVHEATKQTLTRAFAYTLVHIPSLKHNTSSLLPPSSPPPLPKIK
jgi:hypothetical protein